MKSLARIALASTLLAGALAVRPAPAGAQPAQRAAQADSASRAALLGERQRVRAELDRANADIDALKRSGRNLREDYRLRERLADAEALARRLTELDARLGANGAAPARDPGAEPRVSASDGPAELDAKADILADQAQRLAARGDALLGRARDLRARQTLRRRVGQMERDPFAPLEGSKRRALTGSLAASTPAPTGPKGTPPQGAQDHTVLPAGGGTGPSEPAVTTNQGPPPTAGMTSAAAPGGTGTFTPQPPRTGTDTTSPPPTGSTPGVAVSAPSSSPTPTSASDSGALSVQLRDVLDPTTLAQIQHLESAGGSAGGLEALERAGAALKARAERLRQQSAALRASEHAATRAR
jgi:hypothetical protein